jgi:hypothetical protein
VPVLLVSSIVLVSFDRARPARAARGQIGMRTKDPWIVAGLIPGGPAHVRPLTPDRD